MSNAMETLSQLQQLLGNSLADVIQTLAAYLPKLVIAVLLLLIGWVLARLIQSLISRFGRSIDQLTAWMHHQTIPTAQPLTNPPSVLLAKVIYWLVLLLFATAAAESLGLPGLADWVSRFMQYLPNVMASIIIVLLGFFVAALGRRFVSNMPLPLSLGSAQMAGRAVQLLLITIAALLGIDQLGVDISLLVNLVTLAAASVLGGLGLAFGLGARQQVSNIMAAQSVQKLYQPGQRIRIQGIEGEIIQLTAKAVIVKTAQGQAAIPAMLFSEQVSVLLSEDDIDD